MDNHRYSQRFHEAQFQSKWLENPKNGEIFMGFGVFCTGILH